MIKIFYPRIITSSPFENTKIISYRLIVLAKTTNRCILVQRKHTVEFLLLLLGHYRPAFLSLLLNLLTEEEYLIVQQLVKDKNQFKDLFIGIGLDEKDLEYAYLRFNESACQIENFILKNKQPVGKLTYHFPGGRFSLEDKNELECAKREFVEEVEVELPPSVYVSSDPIIIDTLKTLSSCKMIESQCWIYVVEKEFDLPVVNNHIEVNDRKWVDLKEALKLLGLSHHYLYTIQ